MAALNQPYTGDLNGIRDADYECYRQSRKHHYRNTFRAFLASRLQNLNSIVRPQDARLPIVNLKGEILFHSWRDLFTGSSAPFPFAPRLYSFDGRNVLTDSHWPKKLVWHGADSVGQRDVDSYCDAWHSAAKYKFGLASNLLRGKLLEQEKYSCNNAFVVLCVEVGPQADDSLYRSRRSSYDAPHVETAHNSSLGNLWLV
jgi:collagen type XVIII alpha